MNTTPDAGPAGPVVRDDEFRAVRDLLYEVAGISLGDSKRDMVQARLNKRLRHHGLRSYRDYLDLVRADPDGPERQEFVNALTTNKTDFFREPHHFDFLRDAVVPQARARGKRLRVWSAGCSTGEEPYTLAMTLAEHCPAADGWDVRVLATDIDTQVLAAAERGVYDADRVGTVPPALLHKYFLRGTGANAGKVCARRELRDRLSFRQFNLIADAWPANARFDVIFCRNVVIYFDRPTQQTLFTKFAGKLAADGYLFVGHSENLHWLGDTFAPVGGTVYRPRSATDTPRPAAPTPPPKPAPAVAEQTIILGEVAATRGPALLKTLLGSCVSACVYDPDTGVGGMNHFSLPGAGDDGANARYGAYAMELLITAVMKKGGNRDRLRAKVFGGAKVLNVEAESLNVGARNAEFVLNFLQTEGIPVDGQCLGGTAGLLVRFHPHTGRAAAKPLPGKELPKVVRDEQRFDAEVTRRAEAPADDITLF